MGKKKRVLAQHAHNNTKHMRGGPPSAKKKKIAQTGHISAGNQPNKNKNRSSGDNNNAGSSQAPVSTSTPAPAHQAPTIPFAPEESILLVGEGDLSFAASLVTHHGCINVTATVLENDPDELTGKYPHAAANIAAIEAVEGCRVLYGVDAAKNLGPFIAGGSRRRRRALKEAKAVEKVEEHEEDEAESEEDEDEDEDEKTRGRSGDQRADRILFNFPHVGGKSTDVNRQVRYNQELLVGFFRRALPSLTPGGSVVVTLFEGEPYTLWNIRDLGRHAGLQVERSFRFQASAYPGYHHARTLGVVRNRHGETGGGWKGEERLARSYVFVRKGDTPKPIPSASSASSSKKRKRRDEGSSSDDDD